MEEAICMYGKYADGVLLSVRPKNETFSRGGDCFLGVVRYVVRPPASKNVEEGGGRRNALLSWVLLLLLQQKLSYI